MRKALSWLGLIVSGITLALVGIFLVAWLINLHDEPLKAQIQEIIERPPVVTEKGTRAYHYFLGLKAGEKENPEVAGQKIWSQLQQAESAHAIVKDQLSRDTFPNPKKTATQVITAEFYKTHPEWQIDLKENANSLTQYIRWIEFGEVSFLQNPQKNILLNMSTTALKGHRWLAIHYGQLASEGKWNELERLIQVENNFLSSFINHGDLLDVMIAYVIITDNARFLETEAKSRKLQAATKDSFPTLNLNTAWQQAMDQELVQFNRYLQDFSLLSFMEVFSKLSPNQLPLRLEPKWTLQPQETINRYYDFILEAKDAKCEGNQVNCLPTAHWARPRFPLAYLRNPAGRFFMGIAMGNFRGRYLKLEKYIQEISQIRSKWQPASA